MAAARRGPALMPALLLAGLLVGLGAASVVLLAAAPASACSCAYAGLGTQARAADLVVAGTVTDVDRDRWPPWGSGPVEVTVDPDRVWRGEAPREAVVLEAEQPDQGCGPALDEDRRYLLLLSGSPGDLTTNACSGTRPATRAALAAADRRLGDGRPVDVPAGGSGWSVGSDARLVAGGAGLLLAVALVGVARRTGSGGQA